MEQLSILEQAPASSSADNIGCCSRYRKCSDAMRCVSPYPDISARCVYRKNLESGKPFYGKNSICFDPDLYAKIQDSVGHMTEQAREALDYVLVVLRELKRGSRSCIIRAGQAALLLPLEELGVFSLTSFADLLPYVCSLKAVRELLKKDAAGYDAFREAEKQNLLQKKGGTAGAGTAPGESFFKSWLMQSGRAYCEKLAVPYRVVSLNLDQITCIEELYMDRLSATYDLREYSLSPLAEDGLLTPLQIQEEKVLLESRKKHK